MSLTDDLSMPEWRRRRNAHRFGGRGLASAREPLSDDMPMDVWQMVRAQQAGGGALTGEATGYASAGGAGVDPLQGASVAPVFDVDRDFLALREGSSARMYVPHEGNGQVIGRSGPTIGVGVDLGEKDVAYFSALGLSPALIGRLAPYMGKRGAEALAFVNANPLELAADELTLLNEAVQDHELRQLAEKFDAASQVGPFHRLPRDTQTAIASLYFQYGAAAPAKRTPNYWRQITTGDWEGAHANLMDFKDRYEERRKLEAGLLMNDMQSGSLPRRTPAKPGV